MPKIRNGVKLGDGGREVGLARQAQCARVGPEANKIVRLLKTSDVKDLLNTKLKNLTLRGLAYVLQEKM